MVAVQLVLDLVNDGGRHQHVLVSVQLALVTDLREDLLPNAAVTLATSILPWTLQRRQVNLNAVLD